jgi:hypothetical protein
MIVVAAMPVLYVQGVITKFTGWLNYLLPSKQQISENLSLFIAFTGGALVSGIIGNFAYDVLKYVVKKNVG